MTVHPLSLKQTQAVHAIMRLLADDDRARGVRSTARRRCDGCRQERPAAGFVAYPSATLCNHCATRYELARLRHAIPPAQDWIAGPTPDGAAPVPPARRIAPRRGDRCTGSHDRRPRIPSRRTDRNARRQP